MSFRGRRGGPVPVVVVAGYLGAGKSTLLNHLLSGATGVRIGMVVNDFGAVNIDAMLVAGTSGAGAVQSVSLSNGCVCCTVDDAELEVVLGTLASKQLDVIVVEASGLAEPAAMVRRVAMADDPRITYGGLVYVVDGAHFDETVRRHPSLRHHLALADLVVLNKIDATVDPDGVHAAVREHAPSVPIVRTVGAALPPELLVDAEVLAERAAAREQGPRQLTLDEALRAEAHDHGAHVHAHLHDEYVAVDVTAGEVDPRATAALLCDPPPGVFRVKGFVTLPDGTRLAVHTVGRHVRVEPERGRRSSLGGPADAPTVLVFLGIGVDEAIVKARVAACSATPATARDRDGALSLLRFSQAVQQDSAIIQD